MAPASIAGAGRGVRDPPARLPPRNPHNPPFQQFLMPLPHERAHTAPAKPNIAGISNKEKISRTHQDEVDVFHRKVIFVQECVAKKGGHGVWEGILMNTNCLEAWQHLSPWLSASNSAWNCPGVLGGGWFDWKITVLNSNLPLPLLKQKQLHLATASFRENLPKRIG